VRSPDHLHVVGVSWHVDSDNPAWRDVRADAIAEAIAKGRDYATALGGTVTRVEHVADAGLLSSGRPVAGGVVPLGYAGADRSGAHDAGDTPSLDPVPQEIQAVVEARLTAQVAPLA
jgi:uncharacterized protein YggE